MSGYQVPFSPFVVADKLYDDRRMDASSLCMYEHPSRISWIRPTTAGRPVAAAGTHRISPGVLEDEGFVL